MKSVGMFVVACSTLGASCRESTAPADGGLRERWFAVQTGYAYARPAIAGDVVYFGTGDGQLIARDVATGVARWQANIGVELIGGANLLVRNGVVVAPITGYTSGVDAVTGRPLWRYISPFDTVAYRGQASSNPGSLVKSHIDADESTVFIPAWGASVSAVDLRSGAVRWIWTPGPSAGDTAIAGIFRSGAQGVRVSGDTIFVTAWHSLVANGVRGEAWIVALDRRTGRELWRVVMPSYTGGAMLFGAPALYRNLVLFTSVGGYAYAIDRTTRALVWQHTPQPQHSTSAQAEVDDGVLYIDGGDGSVYALDAADGSERWHSVVGVQVTTDFLVTDRRVIFASGAYLIILDRATGQELVRLTEPHTHPDQALFSSAASALGDQIFVSVNNGAWSFTPP